MATPEVLTIDRNIGTISGAVSECCSIAWFADRLQEEGFITPNVHGDILDTRGISPYEKCSKLVRAVRAQACLDQSKFGIFVGILKQQRPLQGVVMVVEQSYQGKEEAIFHSHHIFR